MKYRERERELEVSACESVRVGNMNPNLTEKPLLF